MTKAWNKGIEIAKGDYIAVVNNDVVVPPKWSVSLIEVLDTHQNAGMVSPMTYWIIKNIYFQYNALENFDKTFQKQIVLGDHFFYVKDSRYRDKRTIMRRDDINTNAEFFQYKSQDVDRRDYVQLRYPMFPKNSVWPLADIAALLSHCKINFELEYASNINASDFREKDMIFIGSFHTLGAFAQTFRNSNFTYDVYPNQLHRAAIS